MAEALVMPMVGESVTEGTVLRWLKAQGEGISTLTFSVSTSTRGSSRATRSPSAFSQRAIVPSWMLSPSCGSLISTGIGPLSPGRAQ